VNDQDYNKQFGQEPEFSGARVALAMVILVAVTLFFLWLSMSYSTVAVAGEACAVETQEARITEAITEYKPTVWVFEGNGLNTFMQSLNDWGLMAGRPSNTDKVYVTFLDTHYTVFFLYHGCIVFAAHAPSTVMERILPK
jgi:hypothetical protein